MLRNITQPEPPVVTHTTYTASLFIDGVPKAANKPTRDDAYKWLNDIMKRAHAVGLTISSPQITAIKAVAKHGWSSVTLEASSISTVYYSSMSSDPAILDWHPEWSKE
ncbi:MAG: hypothetical protein IJ210_15145 [Clostridia bacterium]|nr:hypothetical protein [Clostridia bacterium]